MRDAVQACKGNQLVQFISLIERIRNIGTSVHREYVSLKETQKLTSIGADAATSVPTLPVRTSLSTPDVAEVCCGSVVDSSSSIIIVHAKPIAITATTGICSTEWSSDEFSAVSKALSLFPRGSYNRWALIAEYVSELCCLPARSPAECRSAERTRHLPKVSPGTKPTLREHEVN